MEIIPVLDLMSGLVVHAIAGEREKYLPIKNSVLVNSPDPMELLDKLWNLGFNKVYIADLDAILNRGNNDHIVEYALKLGFKVLVDVGNKGVELSDSEHLNYVIGTEYLTNTSLVYGRVLSIDMYRGKVILGGKKVELNSFLRGISEFKLKTIIVISLDRVGTFKGPDFKSVIEVRRMYNGKLLVGGGIRNLNDISTLEKLGVNGVLVASALHKGLIKIK